MSLSPWLDDVRKIIISKQLTEAITCFPADSLLFITDRLAGEYSVSAEVIGARDILFILPVGLPVLRKDSNFQRLDNFIKGITRDDKMISIEVNRGGYRKYGVGVRFPWTNSLTELSRLVEHNLSLQRRFFQNRADLIVQKYMQWELESISEEEFDLLPLEILD